MHHLVVGAGVYRRGERGRQQGSVGQWAGHNERREYVTVNPLEVGRDFGQVLPPLPVRPFALCR